MSVKWARGSCLLTQLFPRKEYFTQTFCCMEKGTRTSGAAGPALSRMLYFLLRPLGWPQWPWLLQVTQSTKEAELGKGRCLCLSFPFLTLMCEKILWDCTSGWFGHCWSLALPEQHQKRISPFSCFISHQKLPLFCLLCTQEIFGSMLAKTMGEEKKRGKKSVKCINFFG